MTVKRGLIARPRAAARDGLTLGALGSVAMALAFILLNVLPFGLPFTQIVVPSLVFTLFSTQMGNDHLSHRIAGQFYGDRRGSGCARPDRRGSARIRPESVSSNVGEIRPVSRRVMDALVTAMGPRR